MPEWILIAVDDVKHAHSFYSWILPLGKQFCLTAVFLLDFSPSSSPVHLSFVFNAAPYAILSHFQKQVMQDTKAAAGSTNSSEDDLTCTICLEQVNKGELVRSLPCLHQVFPPVQYGDVVVFIRILNNLGNNNQPYMFFHMHERSDCSRLPYAAYAVPLKLHRPMASTTGDMSSVQVQDGIVAGKQGQWIGWIRHGVKSKLHLSFPLEPPRVYIHISPNITCNRYSSTVPNWFSYSFLLDTYWGP